jgi:protein-tyrosine phosphatase
VIDLHCHILPGVDDGPSSDAEALALARAAVALGTSLIVATPHRSPRWPTEPATVTAGANRLAELLAAAGIELELRTGAEIALEEAARLDDGTLSELALGHGHHILLESPHEPAGDRLERTVSELLDRGHGIVLAHPERSPVFQDRPGRLREMVETGVLCSITAGALEGRFGPASQWFALELLRDGLVHSLASDAHAAGARPPGLQAGLDAAARHLPGVVRQTHWLTNDAPAAILAGTPLPSRPDLVAP